MLPKKHSNYLPALVNDFWSEDLMPSFFPNLSGFFPSVLDDENWSLTPAVNISEDDKEFRIEVAAPGVEKGKFKVNVEKNILEISAEKEDKKDTSNKKYIRKEFSYSQFSRTFSLPNYVDADHIKATQKDGVLVVEIPKKEEVKNKPKKQIAVS